MKLSDRIRAAIEHSDQSVYRIGLSAQVEEMSLRKFLKREAGLSMNALDRLAKHFGLELSDVQAEATSAVRV
jgi:hypothetical protein